MISVRTSRAGAALSARGLLCIVSSAFAVVLLGGASPVFASAAAPDGSSPASIEPKVLDEIAAQGETTFWVNLHEKADLDPAHTIADRDERGQFVFDRLTDVADQSQARLRQLLEDRGVRYRPFWIVNTIEVTAGEAVLEEVAALPEVAEIEADRVYTLPDPVRTTDERTLATEWGLNAVRAPEVWSTFGVRGEDIVVGSIDSGVRYTHQAVNTQYRGRNSDGTYEHNYNWHDPSNVCGSPSIAPCDNNDHGTHTMGTMLGDDAGPNQVGVAPRAKWMTAKGCETNTCSRPALLSSAQFILAPTDLNNQNPRPDLRPHIVNNSWGGNNGADTWYQASVQAWVASGIFPSFSNGNAGPACGTVGAPASYPESFGVGGFAENGTIYGNSSRGPSPVGSGIKPQVTAPGVAVRSSTADSDSSYALFTGTSMAAPHVSGTVALMWSAAPILRGDITATRALLTDTAVDTADLSCGGTPENNNVWGEGKLDAFAAVDQSPRGPTGTLTGTVTDDSTLEPIAGATVVATGPTNRTTTTNASGQYTLLLGPGTYSVTASARAYVEETVTGVTISQDQTTIQDFALTGLPILVHEETTVLDDDGTIRPGESFGLEEVIRNTGVATATGVTGTLSSQTPGLTVTQPTSDYPDVAPGATATNVTTYQLDVADTVPCGTQLELQLALTSAQGNFTIDIDLLTCELSQTAPIQIPDVGPATPYPSTINVTGFGTNITDVDVRLNGITHTEPDDLDLLLVGPTGQTARIMSDVGGTADVTGVNLTLSDQASASIDNTAALVSGTFRPTNSGAGDPFAAPAPTPTGNVYLSAFNGTDPNGTWSLYVVDDLSGDLGEIAGGWSLIIETGAPPPPPPPCPDDCRNPGTILIPDGPATPYPSEITYNGEPDAQIVDVNLQLNNITHTEPDDLDLMLVGPTGQTAIVMSDVGGSADVSGVTVTLDDQAPAFIPDAGPLVGGAFRPSNSGATPDPFPDGAPAPSGNVFLTAFNGTNPNGTWSLYAVDDLGADWGEISGGWSLEITTGTPPPPPPPCSASPCTNPGAILIPDGPALPYPSTIEVTGFGPSIRDVNLQLHNIGHTEPDDLDLMLVGPTGQTAIVMSDVGGTTDVSGVTLTLDDQATASIPDAGPLASGMFRPTNAGAGDTLPEPAPAPSGNVYLSAFNGTNPNGTWRLFVADDASGEWGEISGGWSLAIETEEAQPPPPPCSASPCVREGAILIPDGPATPYPSSIEVAGFGTNITDVNVQVTGLTHTEPDDLDLLLVGPTGRSAIFMSDVGGGTDVTPPVTLTFDDQAASHLGDSTALVSGTFKPTNAGGGDTFPPPAAPSGNVFLSTFNGTNPNGTWRLFVADDLGGDWGEITGGWRLEIVTGDAPPPPDPCPIDCLNERTIQIPDGPATPYPSSIAYAGPSGVTVTDVNLTLHGLTHTEADDLDLLLVGPTGADAIVMSDAGGTTDITGVTLTIDDQAPALLPDSTVLTSGTFRPANHGGADTFPPPAPAPSGSVPLSVFNGTSPNGTWNLYVADDLSGDWGEFAGGWSLAITTTAPPPELSIDDVSMSEGNTGTTQFTFTVTKSGTDAAASVEFDTANDTATAPGDYAAQSGTLEFAPGETTKTITVLVNGDETFEADETFKVNLSNPTDAIIVDGEGVGTIENDDAAPTLTINNVSHAEGNLGPTAFVFTVTKSKTDSPATVDFATADGTATEPGDYSSANGTLSFAVGEATKTITVLVNGDTTFEANETVFVNLSNPGGATIADGEGQGTIQNDDAPPNFILDANGRQARGQFFADLTWTGATSNQVDIYRNGALIVTTPNDGAHTDALGKQKKGRIFTYKVCNAGTQICSNEASVVS
jgi:subtilisin-like proprotein convertase family protein